MDLTLRLSLCQTPHIILFDYRFVVLCYLAFLTCYTLVCSFGCTTKQTAAIDTPVDYTCEVSCLVIVNAYLLGAMEGTQAASFMLLPAPFLLCQEKNMCEKRPNDVEHCLQFILQILLT